MRKSVTVLILSGILAFGAGIPVFSETAPKVGATPDSLALAPREVAVTWAPELTEDPADLTYEEFAEEVFFHPPEGTESFTILLRDPDSDEEYSYEFTPYAAKCGVIFRNGDEGDEEEGSFLLHKSSLRIEYTDEDGNSHSTAEQECWYSDALWVTEMIGAEEYEPEEYDVDAEEDDGSGWLAILPCILVILSCTVKLLKKTSGNSAGHDDVADAIAMERSETPEDATEIVDAAGIDAEWTPELTEEDLKAEAQVEAIKQKLSGLLALSKSKTTPAGSEGSSPGIPKGSPANPNGSSPWDSISALNPDRNPPTPSTHNIPDYYENPFESGSHRRHSRDNPFEK